MKSLFIKRPASKKASLSGSRGFTLVELMISVAIFVIMTALLVSKYGNFSNNVLLTDAAYDIALSIRTAQTYAISVKGGTDQDFSQVYVMQFRTTTGAYACQTGNAQFDQSDFRLVRAPLPTSGLLCPVQVVIPYKLLSGASLSQICIFDVQGNCNNNFPNNFNNAEIQFQRPNPDAKMRVGVCTAGTCSGSLDTSNGGAASVSVEVQSSDKSTRTVKIYSNGQVVVI